MNRRLSRCRHDRRLAGVAAGVAEYFDLDPTLVRILWVLTIFAGGLGVLLYVGLAIIMPLEPLTTDDAAPEGATLYQGHRHTAHGGGRGTTFVGAALILFGSLALLDQFLPAWVDVGRYAWPVLLIGIGAVLVVGAVRREQPE